MISNIYTSTIPRYRVGERKGKSYREIDSYYRPTKSKQSNKKLINTIINNNSTLSNYDIIGTFLRQSVNYTKTDIGYLADKLNVNDKKGLINKLCKDK